MFRCAEYLQPNFLLKTLDELNAPSRVSGRVRMSAVFDGLEMERPVTPLTLTDVRKFSSGAVWLRYSVNS